MKKYWFVSIKWKNMSIMWQNANIVLDYHPFDWLIRITKQSEGMQYCIIFYDEITKEQYEKLKGEL